MNLISLKPAWRAFQHKPLILVLIIAASIRIIFLYADAPAADMSRSGDFLADEGTWANNALNWALTGKWYIPNGYNPGVSSPVFMLFDFVLLKIFGISLYALRIGGVLCSLVSLYFFHLIITSNSFPGHNPPQPNEAIGRGATLPMLLAATNFPLIIFNRLAFLENLLICFLLWAAYSLMRYLRGEGKPYWLASCWLSIFAGYWTKPSIMFFVLVMIGLICYYQLKRRRSFISISVAMCIIFIVGVVSWKSYYPQDSQCFYQINILSRISFDPVVIIKSYAQYIGHLKFYEFMPITYSLAIWMLLYSIKNKENCASKLPPVAVLWSIWLMVGILFFGFFAYSPPRYSLTLVLPICGLAGYFFSDTVATNLPQKRYIPLFIIALLQCFFGYYRFSSLNQRYASIFYPLLGLLTVVMLFIFFDQPQRIKWIKRSLLLAILLLQSAQIFNYYLHREYSLFTAMEQVSQIIHHEKKSNVIIAGDSAMIMALHAKTRAIDIVFCSDNLPLLVSELKPQYLFLEDPDELTRLKDQLPAYWANAQPLFSTKLMHNYLHGKNAVFYKIE